MSKLLRLLLFLILSCTALSCYDCGPRGEPKVTITLSPPDQLLRVSALGAKSDSVFNQTDPSLFSFTGQFPISLLQDSTTFLFYFPDRVDTLTLFYERVFDVNGQCGFYNDIKAPKKQWQSHRSTFTDVEVTYHSYLGSTAPGQYSQRGISVTINNQ